MKILKNALFFAVIAGLLYFFLFYDINIIKGRRAYEKYFEKNLKDPESFRVYNEDYIKDGGSIRWILDVGARNSFGGMVRKTVIINTTGDKVFVEVGLDDDVN